MSSYSSICPEFVSVIDHEMKSTFSFSLRSLEMCYGYIFFQMEGKCSRRIVPHKVARKAGDASSAVTEAA